MSDTKSEDVRAFTSDEGYNVQYPDGRIFVYPSTNSGLKAALHKIAFLLVTTNIDKDEK